MKGIVQDRYGSPDELELTELDEPSAGEGQVLVRVRAAGVNTSDWHLMRGIPYFLRLMMGLRRPRQRVIGFDVAGVVESAGGGVELQPGDEVLGWCRGGFAELACGPAGQFVAKPQSLGFEEAAALGDSAGTALNAVRDQAKVEPGQEVLVNGASGGVGTYAVQIARAFGARVTAVCSGRNAELVGSLGAERVIDYTREDFAREPDRFDAMLDIVGNRSLRDCRRALKPRGTYVLVGTAKVGRWLGMGRQLRTLVTTPFVSQRSRVFVAVRNRDDLIALVELIEQGKLRPHVGARFGLAEAPAALRLQGEGHAQGKIVLTV